MDMGYPVAFRAADHGCSIGLDIDITSNQSKNVFAQMRLLLQAERSLDNAETTPDAWLSGVGALDWSKGNMPG
jgi:hypothetical protein